MPACVHKLHKTQQSCQPINQSKYIGHRPSSKLGSFLSSRAGEPGNETTNKYITFTVQCWKYFVSGTENNYCTIVNVCTSQLIFHFDLLSGSATMVAYLCVVEGERRRRRKKIRKGRREE